MHVRISGAHGLGNSATPSVEITGLIGTTCHLVTQHAGQAKHYYQHHQMYPIRNAAELTEPLLQVQDLQRGEHASGGEVRQPGQGPQDQRCATARGGLPGGGEDPAACLWRGHVQQ